MCVCVCESSARCHTSLPCCGARGRQPIKLCVLYAPHKRHPSSPVGFTQHNYMYARVYTQVYTKSRFTLGAFRLYIKRCLGPVHTHVYVYVFLAQCTHRLMMAKQGNRAYIHALAAGALAHRLRLVGFRVCVMRELVWFATHPTAKRGINIKHERGQHSTQNISACDTAHAIHSLNDLDRMCVCAPVCVCVFCVACVCTISR